MILDYDFNSKKREFCVSYIDERGHKKLMRRNVNRFKSYYYTPNGPFDSWEGSKCDVKWVDKPSKFDIKTYLREMNINDYNTIMGKKFPRVYTFDIETMIAPDNSFPEPSIAKMPITTISIVSPEMNAIVLGTRELTEEEQQYISDQFDDYLDNTEFFHELKLSEKPKFRYIKFNSEGDMLRYFLSNIVSKVPILSGWNCIFFDWYYITTRVRNYFPDLSLSLCSCTGQLHMKNFTDVRGNKLALPMPTHTLILDMMNVIRDEDYVVLPIKESYGLDYIAYASMGINKIEYDGTLQDLYEHDYAKYVYYNAIDSILVQLIDHRFKTLDHIYMYSLYCMEKIDRCFSKIATTEALVFQDFYDRGLKIVPEQRDGVERSRLQGAYVKKPISGIHTYVCCNDFASLYPSTIRTCNLSFENYVASYWFDNELNKYRGDRANYIVIGPWVYENEGNEKQPSMGKLLYTLINYEALKPYEGDPNYFVSVSGCVYKNDKDYTFRRIQAQLKANRDSSKYLGKKLEATVMASIDHIIAGRVIEVEQYGDDIINACKKINLNINSNSDLLALTKDDLLNYKRELQSEIIYYSCHEQAMKLLMNSMYGGSSHVSFYWYNMNLANDITGESRNLIHKMEHHIPEYWRDNWLNMKDLHKKLGIEIDVNQAKVALSKSPLITEEMDPNAYHDHSYVYVVYGDTDSLYLSYARLLDTIKGIENMTLEKKRDIISHINTDFLDRHNEQFIKEYYDTRFGKSVHNFELETIALSGVWLNVKKRYGQILLWKDGRIFDTDKLPMKIKGLEVVKSSYPAKSRELLKHLIKFLLEHADDKYLSQEMNIEAQRCKDEFFEAPIDDVSGSVKVNNYDKYVVDDKGAYTVFRGTVPWNVRALAKYNQLRNYKNLPGEPVYGGKVKWYMTTNSTKKEVEYFAFTSHNWPVWAKDYVNIDRRAMFGHTVLDPLNRIMEVTGLSKLNVDGSIQMSLF